MIGQKEEPKKKNGRWSYAFIPASLFMGLALGWTLGHLVTKKVLAAPNKMATKRPQFVLRNRVRDTILAIDNELSTEQNAEYRKVLTEFAYRFTDLDLRAKLKKSIN
jgi:hypothetical protein